MTHTLHRPSALSRWTLWAMALLLGLSLVAKTWAADEEDKGQLFCTVPVPPGLSGTEVRDVAVATLKGRQWIVKSETNSTAVGYLKHRGIEATVTLVCDTSKVEVYCVGYKIDNSSGQRLEATLPNRWLKYLQEDLTKRLNSASVRR